MENNNHPYLPPAGILYEQWAQGTAARVFDEPLLDEQSLYTADPSFNSRAALRDHQQRQAVSRQYGASRSTTPGARSEYSGAQTPISQATTSVPASGLPSGAQTPHRSRTHNSDHHEHRRTRSARSKASSMMDGEDGQSTYSLDTSVRPSSMKKDAPWLGTWGFESSESVNTIPPMPEKSWSADYAKQRTQDIPMQDRSPKLSPDLEKQTPPKGPPSGPPGGGRGGPPADPNIVNWSGPQDPENPMNWPTVRKWAATIALGWMTFVVTFSSSVFSAAIVPTAEEYHVSEEVMVLGISLMVLGFAFGPIVWGPMSELYGRKKPMFFGYTAFAVFQIGVGVAPNLYTIFICRFFQGLFGSAPLAIVGGTFVDFWDPVNRGLAVTVFSGAVFMGPIAGPIVGSFVTESSLGWRWTAWITLIMSAFFGVIAFFLVPESFHNVLLTKRAKNLRYETHNWALHSKAEEQKVDYKQIVQRYLMRPFLMLAFEPILSLITIYLGFIYGILYLFFEVYPIVFQQTRGWSPGIGSLPFLGVLGGVVLGSAIIVWVTLTRFKRKMKETGNVVPEERLIPMIVGGALLPIGLFWFAFTTPDRVASPWPQIIAGIPIGAGIQMIFLQGLTYIIDVYKWQSASAIAANGLFRSLLGAAFPLIANIFYRRLGIQWATAILGFIAVGMFPVPILFYIFGPKIRKMSKFVPSGPPPGAGPPGGGPPPGMGGPPHGAGGPPAGPPTGMGGAPSGMSGPPGMSGGPPRSFASGAPPGPPGRPSGPLSDAKKEFAV